MKQDHVYARYQIRPGNHTMEERDAERLRAIRALVLDLLEQDKSAIKIVWWISSDPYSIYNSKCLMIDATVIDLFIESA